MTQNVSYSVAKTEQNGFQTLRTHLMLIRLILDKRRIFNVMHDARGCRNQALQVRLWSGSEELGFPP